MSDELRAMTPEDFEQWMNSFPPGIEPYYSHTRPNEPIGLYRGPLMMPGPTEPIEMDGLIRLEWTPGPEIVWQAVASLDTPGAAALFPTLAAEDESPTSFGELTSIPPPIGPAPSLEMPTSPAMRFSGFLRQEIDEGAPIQYVLFAIPNYVNFHGHWVSTSTGLANGIAMEGGPWRITLTSRGSGADAYSALTDEGGFLLTHAGRLERRDRQAFSTSQAVRALSGLTIFLWFTRGLRTAPILPVGFTTKGRPTFAQWRLPWLDRWDSPSSWLDRIAASTQLQELFPGFMKLWRSRLWSEALTLAVEYYVDANSPSTVNSGILNSQIALELLGWTKFVLADETMTETQFKKRNASDVVRSLLDLYALPKAIPSELGSLTRLQSKRGWEDGPHALSALRNEVAHLRSRSGVPFDAWVDGWRLSIWYLELILLGLMGFKGQYANRLRPRPWVGQVDAVPWADSGNAVTR